jgi:BirA family biotin operon repressor/biotin-[acetyl-CoA-carboxylase] ligase
MNMQPDMFESELYKEVTSLKSITGQHIDREDFLVGFLKTFSNNYLLMEKEGFKNVLSEWKETTGQLGRQIMVEDVTGSKIAEFVDLNVDGHLIYKTGDGELSELVAGDVQWL